MEFRQNMRFDAAQLPSPDAAVGYVRLVPLPPAPPGPINSQGVETTGLTSWTLDAGNYLYTRMPYLIGVPTFENRGTIYLEGLNSGGTARVAIMNGIRDAKNSGTIVGYGHGDYPDGVQLFIGVMSLDNSGELLAVSASGSAQIVHAFDDRARITISGLMAAYSGATLDPFAAITVLLWNGATIHNLAGGKILAEGRNTIAIQMEGSNSDIQYEIVIDGLIEAQAI